jgi:organic hydroperoxide reductase OsmC/OhrA
LSASKGWVVDAYRDDAVGTMAKNEAGKLAMTSVILRPRVTFQGREPSNEELLELHHRAHEECFIASSVKTEVRCEPVTA